MAEETFGKTAPGHLQHYTVAGFGRVGSYSKAKAGKRSRARQHWRIVVWDGRYKDPDRPVLGRRGHVPVPRLGKFRSKKEAIERLKTFAEEVGGELYGDMDGYPRVSVPQPLENEGDLNDPTSATPPSLSDTSYR